MKGWRVPFALPELGAEERAALIAAFDAGWPSLGPRTRELEERLAARFGVAHGVAVSSGTAALHLALASLRLRAGDAIVVPAITFVATASAVVAAGGVPVFADIEALDDPTLSARTVEPVLTERTRAVLAVHYGGVPCEMEPLAALCAGRGLALVEDAAHAPGARLDGRPVGSLGALACFSFYANKNLTTVEGGFVTTDDAERAAWLRRQRSHGLSGLSWERHLGGSPDRDVLEPGFNYRMDDLRAALGLTQLESLERRNARRAAIVVRYRRALEGAAGLALAFEGLRSGREGVAHVAALVVAAGGEARDRLRVSLEEQGIQTSHHYVPVHHLSCYRKQGLALPLSERFAERELSLPLSSRLSDEQVELVAEALARCRQGG